MENANIPFYLFNILNRSAVLSKFPSTLTIALFLEESFKTLKLVVIYSQPTFVSVYLPSYLIP